MTTVIRFATIMPGKTADALAFARSIVKLIGEKYGTKLDLMMPIGGNVSRIAWRGHYTNVGEWETLSANAMVDPEYQALVATTAGFIVPGSVHDEIWRTI